MFKQPFSARGRIRRLEYAITQLIVIVVNVIVESLDTLNEEEDIKQPSLDLNLSKKTTHSKSQVSRIKSGYKTHIHSYK